MQRSSTLRRVASVAMKVVRDERAMRRAAKALPKPVPWDWARPRLLPLLAGPWIDVPGQELVRTVPRLGPAVVFGLPLGPGFTLLDRIVAERWECSADQLYATGMDNLRAKASRLGPETVQTGTLSGRLVRLAQRPPWISSLLLVPDELMRLFGSDDQILAAPGRGMLVSLRPDAPIDVLAGIVVDLEQGETYPLWLDPFGLFDGELTWNAVMPAEEDD